MEYPIETTSGVKRTDIAVIGMSCRFPGASDHEAFWENLKAGRSGIAEVPGNRWDWKAYWGDPQTEKNKSNSKWGGFLKGVDHFDTDFFGLSVKEVERMDPQQRIMLELTWSCFEDAGIRPSDLSGKKVGVFLGVFNFDYKELQERNGQLAIEAHHSTGTASAIIANRVSYYFNLKGPSLPIDTACSSSLSAIHSAIQSLLHGECTLAVAGGINLLLTPTRHISFSKTGMLSPTGSCKTFDDNADGYVRGEGAGLILLKPLAQALLDKDNICGIIKGSAVNHGGKTYSLTYPNPEAQKEVIVDAQKMAGVVPESIGYIEAHGTGTPKGDPIEFQGLTDAFQSADPGEKKGYCGLGSVKTNIGHLEAAAGIAGIIKVLLSMKYKQLPGLQNFKQLNHRISLDDSPFYLVTQLKEWECLRDADNMELPRRAGVSSFGFGGTNAHVVLEEAPHQPAMTAEKSGFRAPPYYLVCISAKTGENLLQKEKDLAAWLSGCNTPVDIADVCKTLSVGREHFPKRTVLIASSTQELQDQLGSLSEQAASDGRFRNLHIDGKKEPALQLFVEAGDLITEALDSNQEISNEEYYRKLTVLSELYLKGYDLDWERPWLGSYGRRISLPVYPFTKGSYWIPELNGSTESGQDLSNVREQKFSQTFTGDEFFIKDHIVKGRQVLPAVVYLEMVRTAVLGSTKGLPDARGSINLENIIWAQPILVGDANVQIHTTLSADPDGSCSFEISGGSPGGASVIYSRGRAGWKAEREQTVWDIEKIREGCDGQVLAKDQCYRMLGDMGFDYGPSHRGLEAVHTSDHRHLAKIVLPAIITETINDYFIHPSLMDAALQASLLIGEPGIEKGIYLPFALEQLEIAGPCTGEMWAVISSGSSRGGAAHIKRVDIDLCDKEGKVCMRMKGLSFKLVPDDGLTGVLLLQPDWKEKPAATGLVSSSYLEHLVFLCEPGHFSDDHVKEQWPDTRFILLQGVQINVGQRYQSYTRRVFEEIKTLLGNKPKGKILVQIVVFEKGESSLFSGMSGLLRTARAENPNCIGQLIRVASPDELSGRLKENALQEMDHHIRYIDGKRMVLGWKEVMGTHNNSIVPWKDNGVYLITGGAGGLGLLFAKEIAAKVKTPSLILISRSPLNEAQKTHIDALRSSGARVEYRQVDVSDKRSLAKFIQNIQADFSGPHGIIHSAGIVQDNFIIKKTSEELLAVLSPKVSGVTWLDEVTEGIPLDFFILFSSVVAPLGNAGQADYAAANAYLDEYAVWRNRLVGLGERHGHTVSINWPLWKEGGMQLGKELEKGLLEQMKMSLLETAAGIQSLYRAMIPGVSQVMVASGKSGELKDRFLEHAGSATPVKQWIPEGGIPEGTAINYFKELLSVAIKRPVAQIDADAAMEEYGIDSIMVMQMTSQMETVFGTLPKTLFFEYQNIQELTQYFLENHSEKLGAILHTAETPVSASIPVPGKAPASGEVEMPGKAEEATTGIVVPAGIVTDLPLDIAIIGVAGRYPQADNLQEFWDNLSNGKDCITEIPKDRWDYQPYFDADKDKEGKSYSKWGGFLNDVDKFDPLFFNISPSEAERMDPQERLFLQCVYETIEDAGYTRQSLSQQKHFGLGNQVGVFVGVMYEEYQLFGAQEAIYGRPVALWGLPSSIANRVSYFCDFHGPSMAIDTMCSSSLTAIHLACESIVRGKCEVAIAGGVNVSIHPNKYLFLSQGRFASSKGRCESFGIGGDGYVPGEGVGAVLLKPLDKAIADGDNIYGVIRSTAINHGGKTNGYTVPNLKAQASVIGRAFKEAGIDPRAISYLEAHGTGTSLGDPVEIAGLSRTMQEYTTDTQFCAIGSAKSNIGHCESAAGIAGITKVLLQIKYRQIVPSLHSGTLNANIDFADSPFVVQQGLSAWKRPVLEKNGKVREYPLCAGISSFGAGGANAHIIVEEYIPDSTDNRITSGTVHKKDPVIILLSAMDEDRLTARAKQLLTVIQRENRAFWKISEELLADMAYTLQIGREHMEYRLALPVTSVHELEEKLRDFVSGKQNIDGLFLGQASARKEAAPSFAAGDDMVAGWVKGVKVDWKALYKDAKLPRRVSMPAYPFKKDRYWIGEVSDRPEALLPGKGEISYIHPLLHENISDLSGQRFSISFSGEEPYLKDHLVNGRKILPAVAYLEMVREAVWQSVRSFRDKIFDIQLKHITWTQPIAVGEKGIQVNIELRLEENGEISFDIYRDDREDATERDIFSQGSATISTLAPVTGIGEAGILALQKECSDRVMSKTACYEAFEKVGFQYGPAHRGLEEVYIGDNKILAKIALPPVSFDRQGEFMLHPGLMDPALQATLLWDPSVKMLLPIAVEEVRIYQEVAPVSWVIISRREGFQDIDILNGKGEISIRLKGVSFKAPSSKGMSDATTDRPLETLLLLPEWERKAIHQAGSPALFSKHMIVLCGLKDHGQELAAQLPDAEINAYETSGANDFRAITLPVFERIRALLKGKEKGNTLMQVVIPVTGEQRVYAGISGLLKTAEKENPHFFGQVISISDDQRPGDLIEKIRENSLSGWDKEIRYEDDHRTVLKWKVLENDPAGFIKDVRSHPWKDGGIYLITGGTGGLGFIFANEIAQNAREVTLVLTGRSSLDDARRSTITGLQKLGASVTYKQMDVTNQESVQQLIQSIREEAGHLTGIIHSAGIVRDNFLMNKTNEEWNEVLAPKVDGIRYLDQASKDIRLDIFIFFSSVTGAMGNAGQADYATANAFMDEYAGYRNALVAGGLRYGHTLSVNWPLWQEGGMHVDKEAEKYLFDTLGMVPLPTKRGIDALYRALSSKRSRVMVVEGDREKIILSANPVTPATAVTLAPVKERSDKAPEEAIQYFSKLLSSVIKLPADRIKPEVPMEEYGIDSVMVMKMTGKLEKVFGTLSKTLFFEYQNIRALTAYFLEEHYAQLAAILGIEEKTEVAKETVTTYQTVTINQRRLRSSSSGIVRAPGPLDIAIVGVAGKYPQADNLEEFWENLCKGKDCITEIPNDRWDHRLYFDADKSKAGKTYSKWGGFLNGIDEFDALFFNISPREAELLDPQERLFLQCAYETIADAGYSRQTLSADDENGLAGNVGVYVGVMYEEYQLFGVQESMNGRNIALFGNPSSIANRVSYFYNFNGPSMAVDTMCSSSLTAIHLACQGIYNGDCKAAIAGGVNISIHPNKYLLLAQGKFISGKGRCESFGVGGDGYVPGEGVGAVLLKPLSQAIADGDHVYGVIKATSINHGGKTNGYTVPNPNAQAKVIGKAYQRSGIDPRTISYLEAHGTGTSLGDPIEITGLKKAYQEYTRDNGFCAIGSVKSNIGHGESAAGIAGVTKILLQLKYKQLVPSLHSEELNPNIDFANSPFVVQQSLSEWKRPVIGHNGQARESLRRAGISSFGAGGSNAHLVIEEFDNSLLPKRSPNPSGSSQAKEPVIILLSAKNNDRLKELTERVLKALQKAQFKDSDLLDIAFTLQTGRDALETRLAVIVRSIEELCSKLQAFLKGEEEVEALYHGKIERDNGAIEAFAADEELQEAVEKWIRRKKYAKLCDFWVKGLQIDWSKWYKQYTSDGMALKRVSLPGYPFSKERYWVPAPDKTSHRNDTSNTGTMLLQPVWTPENLSDAAHTPGYAHHRIISIDSIPATSPEEGFTDQALRLFTEIQTLLQSRLEGKILVQVVVPTEHSTLSALHALLRTAQLENPQITGQLIETGKDETPERIASILTENSRIANSAHIRYMHGQRQVLSLKEYKAPEAVTSQLWKEGGVYLVTGGTGEIGLVFAREILRQVKKATIIFIGRSPLSGRKQDQIKSLPVSGGTVEYKQVDVSEKGSIAQLIDSIQREHGILNGIIHSAGVTRDNFLIHKTRKNWQEVFAPKVTGLINLDEATKALPLDFFIIFSSIAGVLGNPGQADYATANAFMDAYACLRNKMVADRKRMGHTLSINWPLWKEGGMHVYKEVEEDLEKRLGILPLDTAAALQAFYQAAFSKCDQIMVLYGDSHKIHERLLAKQTAKSNEKDISIRASLLSVDNGQLLQEKTVQLLKGLFGEAVKLSPERIDEKEEFQAYGLNSVMIVQLNQMLERIFGELSKTLFYEHQNLSSLAAFLIKDHGGACMKIAGLAPGETSFSPGPESPKSSEGPESQQTQQTPESRPTPINQNACEPIAIIGMSGRYPMADSLQAYWENLKTGRDCISEIPNDRWSLDGFFDPDKERAIGSGRSYSKWGGFLEGFADFDPLFFNISPREAVSMDPQERIFLQACWEVFEDAGYTREHLAKKYNNNVGVFAGVTKTGFELHGPELWRQGEGNMLRTSFSSVANRVSYHLNLRGPSMPVDTMCSSSLTAIHEACENLYRGACEIAIAGGVNLYLHPSNYTGLCAQSFLSPDGKCRSFGKGGSGFVPGEGVGVVLLKPLSRAIADGDNIHAVIRGTGINHGGRTSGYTVPNPVAQTELIRKTLDKAGVNAREISYMEAHGTGTSLGDPIEITGLSHAFREDTPDVQFCAIGSAKSNIGHLEAAAGIAGIAKMVLQMKHGMLVPSLHAGELNPNINFERSPFFVQQELSEWERPRIASISSFGAGGSNAHVIIEEYVAKETTGESHTALPALIVLSAMDENRLKDQAVQLLKAISQDTFNRKYKNLSDAAYTLQVGREAMEERLAVKVNSSEELQEKLADFLSGKKDIERLYRGRINDRRVEPIDDRVDSWIEDKEYDRILGAWVKGAPIEWDRLYTDLLNTGKYPQRISLPTYPFAKIKYWLSGTFTPSISALDISAPDKKWLFSKEEWKLSPVAKEIDWSKRLQQYAGKRICIVYSEEGDLSGLTSLLDRLRKAGGLEQPLAVTKLHIRQIDVEAIKTIRPEIILFSGPEKVFDPSVRPTESDLLPVYNLSKCLMQTAWDAPIDIYYLFETGDANARLDCEALSGFFSSAMKENNQHVWKSICLHNVSDPAGRHQIFLKEWLTEEFADTRPGKFTAIQYREGQRFGKELTETSLSAPTAPGFRKKGNYIVAGGMGYIGGSLLQELAKRYQANLVILSRGDFDNARKEQCEELERLGAKVYYHVVDITDMKALQAIYTAIKQEIGDIHGVINLARVHDSKSIASKTWESFYGVSQVKMTGTLNLDLLTKEEHLDIFMLFASIGGYGARGDSDYAFSVAFQNAFARYRNQLRKEGQRHGISVSQCWGPWEEDKLFPESRKKMSSLGLDLINMGSAFQWIEASCLYEDAVIGICAVLDKEKVKAVLGMKAGNNIHALLEKWEQERSAGRSIDITVIRKAISIEEMKNMDISLVERIYRLSFENRAGADISDNINVIRELVIQVLEVEDLDNEKPFQDYGLDSIMAMRLSTSLEKKLKREVKPHLLIEFPTVKELSHHLNSTKKGILI